MSLAAARFRKEHSSADVAAMVARLASDRGLGVVQHNATRDAELRVLRLDEPRLHLAWVGTGGRLKYIRLRDIVKIEVADDFDGRVASSSWAIWMRGNPERAACYLSLRLRREEEALRRRPGHRGAGALAVAGPPECLSGAKRVDSSLDLEFASGLEREIFIDALEELCEKAQKSA